MELYFNSYSAISPLSAFDNEVIDLNTPSHPLGYLIAEEPDYKTIIDKKYIRRMSRFIKMAITNAIKCLADAGLEQPDAIITGTALGCVTDTIDFLQQININSESLLNPTAFIQSTHNTASGQIALILNCKHVNLTFSQKNISFESGMLQTKMMLEQGDYQHILVGGIDEITPESYQLISKTSCYHNPDTILGEGAAFFVLSNLKSGKNCARFNGMSIFTGQFSEDNFPEFLHSFLAEHKLTQNEVDLILTGGYLSDDSCKLLKGIFNQSRFLHFKEFCGEYDTSTAFALWLTLSIFKGNISDFKENLPRTILIHNQGSGFYHSLILVSQC